MRVAEDHQQDSHVAHHANLDIRKCKYVKEYKRKGEAKPLTVLNNYYFLEGNFFLLFLSDIRITLPLLTIHDPYPTGCPPKLCTEVFQFGMLLRIILMFIM